MKALTPIAAAGALLVFGLGGCAQNQDGSNAAGDPISPSATTSTTVKGDESATAQQIANANLQPCPVSDPNIEALADGLPDLTLNCLGQGPSVRLAGLRGKPLVVNVWASWCGPCRAELPLMGKVARSMPAVQFLGIDMADSRSAALEMAGNTNMSFPSVMDPESKIRAGLRVVGVPQTFFVQADGRIVGRTSVISSEQELLALIERHLGVKQ